MHDCPFNNDHSLGVDSLRDICHGFCPLCMHDFAGQAYRIADSVTEYVCIECEHVFNVDRDSNIEVVPLEG